MWTFDNPPLKRLREAYGFRPSQEWLDHVRLASVRINDGGSGSFVSPRGLILTNHHVARGQIQKLSTEDADYVANGFYAATLDEELACPDLEVNVLVSVEDVTARVRSVIKPEMSEAEAHEARRAETARIEKESLDRTGLRSNVVSLYHGGEYWLYRYKRYTDIRLVMAPEHQATFFGGDHDNFTYPRYCLDFTFLRAYENGEPAATPQYLRFNVQGPARDELVFISGNPGETDRLFTQAQLDYQRDTRYPATLEYLQSYVRILEDYAAKGPEEKRRAQTRMLNLNNSIKAYRGYLEGLENQALMSRLAEKEEELRGKVAADPALESKYGDAWDAIARATDEAARTLTQRMYRELIGSPLADKAQTIVQYVVEVEKPDAERLEGFHDSQLESLRFQLFSPAPVYPDMEAFLMGGFLEQSGRKLGDDDPFIRTVLAGRSGREAAADLIRGTKLADVDFRRSLIEGGKTAVEASRDPLIVMARGLDPLVRADEKWYRENILSVLDQGSEKIAQARFAVYGKTIYPDATFTLRLGYGTAKGYPMNGTIAPYKTTLYGLYDRALSFDSEGEFKLPERFWKRQDRLDLATPVNFVATLDIIGGNSGSPVINTDKELVGLIFDGNIQMLVFRFAYDDELARAVSVHPAYIMESLRKLYDAGALADELEGN